MDRANLSEYARAWRERFARVESERRESAARARALVPVLARHLVERYGVSRVWLFGSLAEVGFDDRSDIDLAVEGFPPGAVLFRAAAELDELARPFGVDLVPLEDAREAVRERILRRGELVHDGARS